ncbi:DUF3732 domain-containing protein [Microvirga tunisiensis]|uniref:DUF3732 domain-containing protein n=1 Tax=Microvirga tunisiensis TaxID=2108360 RepID=A0A5N7MUK1_9HYPH|nr:DUF3732 domain-containing protein [Microvirga tunisiensis]MPR11787.1 DUF3732 domain-containing protein [Microvirga tunisiensis]MPR29774.1 DUF3732 domain-containing protein [Microvirga tunisiensis]
MRWNIERITFYSHDGRRRDIVLTPGSVNIITGASGTGKSALIRAIDYCLGSKDCDLPEHVKIHASAVAVLWTNGEANLLTARIIPPSGQATSTRMFVAFGAEISLPDRVEDLPGSCNLATARVEIQRAFGIGDVTQDVSKGRSKPERISIRHITPYLFLSKSVIDSETILFHGMDNKEKAEGIIGSMPYFLGAMDEESIDTEKRLKQLRKALESELARMSSRDAELDVLKQRALSLLGEAAQCGIAPTAAQDSNLDSLLNDLNLVAQWSPSATPLQDDSALTGLYDAKAAALSEIAELRRQRRIVAETVQYASGFSDTVSRQLRKVAIVETLNPSSMHETCPVCLQHTTAAPEMLTLIRQSAEKLKKERTVTSHQRPRLEGQIEALNQEIEALTGQLRSIDNQISSLISAADDSKRLADNTQRAVRVVGRVSYFLEAFKQRSHEPNKRLSEIEAEISDLEANYDPEYKELRLRTAESEISRSATDIIKPLPTEPPCTGAEIQFLSKKPDIVLVQPSTKRIVRFGSIGSDQNYLAIHLALIFAIQRFLKETAAPVPGVVVVDQVSRPYFPSDDETDEINLDQESEDEDTRALKRHFDFLFSEVAREQDLQIVVLEHAYFAEDPRYTSSTKYRWTKASGEKLIPRDWPIVEANKSRSR